MTPPSSPRELDESLRLPPPLQRRRPSGIFDTSIRMPRPMPTPMPMSGRLDFERE